MQNTGRKHISRWIALPVILSYFSPNSFELSLADSVGMTPAHPICLFGDCRISFSCVNVCRICDKSQIFFFAYTDVVSSGVHIGKLARQDSCSPAIYLPYIAAIARFLTRTSFPARHKSSTRPLSSRLCLQCPRAEHKAFAPVTWQ